VSQLKYLYILRKLFKKIHLLFFDMKYQYAGVVAADDNDVDNLILKKQLEIAKVSDVKMFNSLSSIKSHLQSAIGSGKLPALIFLDYLFVSEPSLPILEFLDKNAKDAMAKRVVMISSMPDPNVVKKVKSFACVADFIEKPMTKEKVADAIKKYMK
jgi:response regulator of citrate/malate metabolism